MREIIKLSGVPETMLQTVYARAKESNGRGAIHDAKAEELIEKLDYDFSLARQRYGHARRRHRPHHCVGSADKGLAWGASRRGGGQHRLRAGHPLLSDVRLCALV